MITAIAHLRFGDSAQLHGHHVARFVTGYEVDGARAVSREEAEAILARGSSAAESARETARGALAPYNIHLPAERAGLEKLVKSLRRYIGAEGRELVALVEAVLELEDRPAA